MFKEFGLVWKNLKSAQEKKKRGLKLHKGEKGTVSKAMITPFTVLFKSSSLKTRAGPFGHIGSCLTVLCG